MVFLIPSLRPVPVSDVFAGHIIKHQNTWLTAVLSDSFCQINEMWTSAVITLLAASYSFCSWLGWWLIEAVVTVSPCSDLKLWLVCVLDSVPKETKNKWKKDDNRTARIADAEVQNRPLNWVHFMRFSSYFSTTVQGRENLTAVIALWVIPVTWNESSSALCKPRWWIEKSLGTKFRRWSFSL